MIPEIAFTAPANLTAAIASLGRTEDVTFSPDGKRLAIAGYSLARLLVADVVLESAGGSPRIALTDFVEMTSPVLNEPHGICFLDSETLIVSNRGALVNILNIPPTANGSGPIPVLPLRTIGGTWFRRLKSPGSVATRPLGNGLHEVLVCNNYINVVTRHVLNSKAKYRIKRSRRLLEAALDVPDGIAFNRDGSWIAVSNHMTQSVLLFENTVGLNRHSTPVGSLRGVQYPHGVRFTSDDRFAVVADAGSPNVHAFRRDGDTWAGSTHRAAKFQVMSDAMFARGRINIEEGGPKGVAIDPGMTVIAVTSEHQPLAFFDLGQMLDRGFASTDGRV